MKYILFLVLHLLAFTLKAQVFEWVNTNQLQYAMNPGLVSSTCCNAPGGHCWLSRNDSIYLIYGSDPYGSIELELYSSSGNLLSVHHLGNKVAIADIITDQQGNLFVSGYFMETLEIDNQDSLNNTGTGLNADPFLLCIDTGGSIKWKRNLGGGAGSNPFTFGPFATSPSGKVYYSICDFSSGAIICLDSLGFDGTQIQLNGINTIGDVKFDTFGNAFIAGSTSNGTMNIGTFSINVPEAYMLFIARINSSGQTTWVQLAHDITFQYPKLVTDLTGNAYMASNLMDSITWGNQFLNGPDWVFDFSLVKVDSMGIFLWAKEVPNPSSGIVGDFQLADKKCLAYDPAGRILMGGILRGSIDWGNGVTANHPTLSQRNFNLVCFDESGVAFWTKSISNSFFKSMHSLTQSGGEWYISAAHNAATGISFDTITVNFLHPQNTLLAKLNNNMTTGMNHSPLSNAALFVYPNPAEGYFILPETWIGGGIIRLFSMNGQLIGELKSSSEKVEIPHLKTGNYLLEKNGRTIRIAVK